MLLRERDQGFNEYLGTLLEYDSTPVCQFCGKRIDGDDFGLAIMRMHGACIPDRWR